MGATVTEEPDHAPIRLQVGAALFPTAIFVSASLVFLVQPMVAKLLLPKLGGSPAVWNASMAFFQAMLLIGYAYAYLLQRLRDLKWQVIAHIGLLLAAALALPIGLSAAIGDPSPNQPVRWLLMVLIGMVGAPFAVLSATAPLLQAWFTRFRQGRVGGEVNPYPLYVASNVGSILALVAYPVVVEPLLTLSAQTLLWTAGYGLFVAVAVGLAILILCTSSISTAGAPIAHAPSRKINSWRQRVGWTLLAAAASSLMLGVTTYISTDVAAMPFLWVLPLALYLVTFVVSFQQKPAVAPKVALLAQSVLVPLCLASMPLVDLSWSLLLLLHLSGFFFTALVCHQALSARRPDPARLTEFYFFVSLGGVIGGATTAFLAPVLFNFVLEYPLVLVLAALARPRSPDRFSREDWILCGVAIMATAALTLVSEFSNVTTLMLIFSLSIGVGTALLLRSRRWPFTLALAALATQAIVAGGISNDIFTVRSFFGVNRVKSATVAALGGGVHLLAHGTTVHGSQALSPTFRCRPTSYYAPEGAIGQVYTEIEASQPKLNIGVVGLGSGELATYARQSDRMRFFEIDPAVEMIARNPIYFSYLSTCAKGAIDVVLGDARLTLAHEPKGSYDLLLLDAFTSDAIPTHLLTAEALKEYLDLLKPNGVLLLHISNRHLALEAPVAATAAKVGAGAIIQNFRPAPGTPALINAPTDVVLVSRSSAALAKFRSDPRWRAAIAGTTRAWTDDYTNILGALLAKKSEPASPRPR